MSDDSDEVAMMKRIRVGVGLMNVFKYNFNNSKMKIFCHIIGFNVIFTHMSM